MWSLTWKIFNEKHTAGIFLKFVLILLALSFSFTPMLYLLQKNSMKEDLLEEGKLLAWTASINSRNSVLPGKAGERDLKRMLEAAFRKKEVLRLVIAGISRPDAKGRPVAPREWTRNSGNSGESLLKKETVVSGEKLKRLLNERSPFEIETRDGIEFWAPVLSGPQYDDLDYMFFATHLIGKNDITGFVAVTLVKDRLNSRLRHLLYQCLEAGVFFFIVGSLVAYRQVRKVAGSINRTARSEEILADGVMHDFRNILSLVVVNMLILKQKLPDPMDKNRVDKIILSTHQGSLLINRLRRGGGKVGQDEGSLEINHHISTMVELLRPLAGDGVALKTELSPNPMEVAADCAEMDQMILNLVINARDSMPDGGTITIKTESRILDRKFQEKQEEGKPCQFAVITVSDTGRGIPRADLKKIFDPFFSTKGEKGTGLGLWTTLETIKKSHGFIDVDSEIGRGTVFTVFLPVRKK